MNNVRFNFNQKLIIVAIVCAILAFAVNKINIKHLYHQTQIEWLSNQKVTTADDASYIRPAENFIQTGIWKDNFLGKSTYYQRSPGYGGVYLVFKLLFKDNTIGYFLEFQTLLFGLGVYLLGKILYIISKQEKLALIFVCLYGLLPSAYGFIFYNITEGITPFLVIALMYFWFKINEQYNQNINHLLVAVLSMILLLVRPQLIPLIMVYPLLIVFKTGLNSSSVKNIIIYVFITFSGFGLWTVRNYQISGNLVGLHPIYDNTNNTQYRPTHFAFGELYRIWEYKPEDLHQSLVPIWLNTINGDAKQKDIENAVNLIPNNVKQIIPSKQWVDLFTDYQYTIKQQKMYYDRNVRMPAVLLDDEIKLIEKINQYKKRLKKEMWLTNYVITPLKSYKHTAIHSNLNLYIFQNTYRGRWWMETLRWLSFIVFSGSIFVSLWLWLFKVDVLFRLISFSVFIYTFYLVFVQRMNETRYMHPLYPIAFVLMFYSVLKLKNHLLKKQVVLK